MSTGDHLYAEKPELATLFGLPLVWSPRSGDILVPRDTPSNKVMASVVSKAQQTPSMLGPPVSFRHFGAFIETGSCVLSVGLNRITVFRASRLLDSMNPQVRDDSRMSFSLNAADVGLSRFLDCYGWLTPTRFVLAGLDADGAGKVVMMQFEVSLNREVGLSKLQVRQIGDPPGGVLIASGAQDVANWRGSVFPAGGSRPSAIAMTGGGHFYLVTVRDGNLVPSQPCVISGGLQVPLRVLAPVANSLYAFVCLQSHAGNAGGCAQNSVVRLDISSGPAAELTPLLSCTVEWAKLVSILGRNFLAYSTVGGVVALRELNSLHGADWARYQAPTRDVARTCIGPDYVATFGDHLGARFLWVAPLAGGEQIYAPSARIVEPVLSEALQLVGGPDWLAICHAGNHAVRVNLFPIVAG